MFSGTSNLYADKRQIELQLQVRDSSALGKSSSFPQLSCFPVQVAPRVQQG